MKKYVDGVLVDLTEEEITARQAKEAEWASRADARTAEQHRKTRNELLVDSDWTQMPDSPLTSEVKTSWATYRTALRDLPDHSNWPNLEEDDWPTKP